MAEMNKKKRRWLLPAAAVSAAVLLAVGSVTAYFTDTKYRENVITIGKTDLELTEPHYPDPSQTVEPGSVVAKDQKLRNTGDIDEYVFMKLEVPKAQVTLLNESGADIGKPVSSLSGKQQIFKLLTSGGGTDVAVPPWQ